jgi:hypothetical protein
MGVIENAKEIGELIKKYNDQDLDEKIVELREQIIFLREENIALRESLDKLENSLKIEKGLIISLKGGFRNEKRNHYDTPRILASGHLRRGNIAGGGINGRMCRTASSGS